MQRTALLLGAAMALGFPQHGYAETETIATTGDQAGGVPAGAVFSSFETPVLNDAGRVAYEAFLLPGSGGVATFSDNGVWLDQTLIARELSQAGETPAGAVFESFGPVRINEAGQVAYSGRLLIGFGGVDSTNNLGIWRQAGLIARSGSPAGGTSAGELFVSFGTPSFNNAGQVAFSGFLLEGVGGVDSTNSHGIWLESTLIAREGSQAGGVPAGAVFGNFGIPVLNDLGQVAYWGSLQQGAGGVDSTNDSGIWRDSALIVRAGVQAGGAPAGAVFSGFNSSVRFNDAGQVAYEGILRQGVGGVNSSNDSGLWRDSTLIAREGSQAGGVSAGAVFDDFAVFVLNNAGNIVYRATLEQGVGGVDSTNDTGIWRDSTLVVREGSQASGIQQGIVYNTFSTYATNDAGQVAYEASLRVGDGGGVPMDSQGIWISGTNGETILAVLQGTFLAGRVVGNSIQLGSLNNFSQVAYLAGFTNGESGIFLYTPEIHWTRTTSGGWDTDNNWTIAQRPGDPHDVFIDPDLSLTVNGPSGDVMVENLTIGGSNGIATLSLNGGTITTSSIGRVIVESTGVLTGDGVIGGVGGVINLGTVLADNVTVVGTLFNSNIIAGDGRINAAIANDGRIEAIGTAFTPAEIRFDGLVTNIASTGMVAAEHGTLRFNAGLTNHGAVAVSFGTSRFFGDIDNTETGSIVLSGGSNTTFYDDVTNNGGIIVAAAGTATSTAVFFGDVSGAGSITGGGNVFLHGDLRPGNSPAAVNHDVYLFLLGTSSTQIELGGTTPGSQHDQINNLKSTTIGGTLDIQLINGFDPNAGDTFDIFNFATSTGTFADVLLPTLDTGLGWHLGELYTDGELHVELLGDLNQDGFVGIEDLDLLLANWGDSALAFDYAAGDASGDGLVGAADLALVQANWGNGTPGGGNVPEPGSLALLGLGGLMLARRRR